MKRTSPTPTWSLMLALVSSSAVANAGCSVDPFGTSSTSGSGPGHTEELGHPCYGKSTCDTFVVLPDGRAVSSSEATDAGADAGGSTPDTRMCGPCNG